MKKDDLAYKARFAVRMKGGGINLIDVTLKKGGSFSIKKAEAYLLKRGVEEIDWVKGFKIR